jgi:hypothetical protein
MYDVSLSLVIWCVFAVVCMLTNTIVSYALLHCNMIQGFISFVTVHDLHIEGHNWPKLFV